MQLPVALVVGLLGGAVLYGAIALQLRPLRRELEASGGRASRPEGRWTAAICLGFGTTAGLALAAMSGPRWLIAASLAWLLMVLIGTDVAASARQRR